MTVEKKHVFSTRIALRRGDIDDAGHVNNVNYFRFMEEARLAWYATLGVGGYFGSDPSESAALPENCGPIIVQASCSFMKALKYPGDVLIDLSVGEPGRASIMIWCAFRASYAPDTVFAEATCKAVWIDKVKEKSIPLPEPLRKLFE